MKSTWPRVLKTFAERCGGLAPAANEIGISRRQLIRLCMGKCAPRERTQRAIEDACERFQVNASDLPGVRGVLVPGAGKLAERIRIP